VPTSQIERASQSSRVLQQYVVCDLVSEGLVSQPVTGMVKAFDSFPQLVGLGIIGKQLDLDSEFHCLYYRRNVSIEQS
jgi:hypothetical protein